MRHKRIGGTDIAALLGTCEFRRDRVSVYRSIVEGFRGFKNKYMDRGIMMEPILRKRAGYVLDKHPGTLYMDDCFAGSLDDVAIIDGLKIPVDYKTASINGWGKKWTEDKFPENYRCQLALYIPLMSAALNIPPPPYGELYVAFGKDCEDGSFETVDTRTYRYERDIQFEELILETGRAFWRDHIVPKVPPFDRNGKLYVPFSPVQPISMTGVEYNEKGELVKTMGLTAEQLKALEELDSDIGTLEAYVNKGQGFEREPSLDLKVKHGSVLPPDAPDAVLQIDTLADGGAVVRILPPDAPSQTHPDFKETK